MKKPMVMSVSVHGMKILYRCYHMPDHGKKCPDRNTSVCMKCKYAKAEMAAGDATRMLNRYTDYREDSYDS